MITKRDTFNMKLNTLTQDWMISITLTTIILSSTYCISIFKNSTFLCQLLKQGNQYLHTLITSNIYIQPVILYKVIKFIQWINDLRSFLNIKKVVLLQNTCIKKGNTKL